MPKAPRASPFLVYGSDRPCPLCGCDDRHLISAKMQHGLDCATVVCKSCGFCFVSPMPKREVYERFYRVAYAHYYHRYNEPVSQSQLNESESDKSRLDKIEMFKKLPGASVLEVGPGNGRFLLLTERRGATCSAIEPSTVFREYLANTGINVIGGFLEETHTTDRFDIAFLFQVLEHFQDPVHAMRAIARLLKDDGLLVVDVPNILRPYRDLDRHFFRYVHMSYFSPNSLKRLISAGGFRVVHLDEGSAKDIFSPQPIFCIAAREPRAVKREATCLPVGDNWQVVSAHLKRYRWKYRLVYFPWMRLLSLRKRLRAMISSASAWMVRRVQGRPQTAAPRSH